MNDKPKWHKGAPPSIGWWPANFTSKSDHKGGRNPRIIRWWDGQLWSTAAFPDFTAKEAADSAYFKARKQDCIEWTERWWL